MNRINPITDTTDAEIDLNNACKNWFVPKEDAQLFVKLNEYNYYPIETHLNSSGDLVIEDTNDIQDMNLYLGTKRQFIYKRFDITTSNVYFDIKSKDFNTAWNPEYYRIFRNGYLMNKAMYKVKCPTIDNIYNFKRIYSYVKLQVGDRLDVFYIEDKQNFKNISFNQDVYLKTTKVYAEVENQTVVKVPYPYYSYPRDPKMFLVFQPKQKLYLRNDSTGYTPSANGEYITLRVKHCLETVGEDYIVFVFPYCVTNFTVDEAPSEEFTLPGFDPVEEITDITLHRSVGVSEDDGVITFEPSFTDYEITKDNILVYYENKIIDPVYYEVLSNTQIKSTFGGSYDKYSFIVFNELDERPDGSPNRLLQFDRAFVKPRLYEDP